MKSWVKKIADQFELDWGNNPKHAEAMSNISEEKATLLYLLDVYNKHLFEIDKHPVRKVRDMLDEISRELLDPRSKESDKLMFKIRQFFSQYRVDEHSYIQKTFEDFKGIIWDFAHQLGDDLESERSSEAKLKVNLDELREAVESNSIEELRSKSREFINHYVKFQSAKDDRRVKRMSKIKLNLNSVKRQLFEANESMRMDHMTGAHNRKSFEEQLKKHASMFSINQNPVSLVMLDIDHFKKINDSFGHDVGDFIIKECVRIMKESFATESSLVARIGGEEFAVILPDTSLSVATKLCQTALENVRKEAFVQNNMTLRFTVSMGVAQLDTAELVESWMKRADLALYNSKNTGRNKVTSSNDLKSVTAA